MIDWDLWNVALGYNINNPQRLGHNPVCERMRRRASSGVSAHVGSAFTSVSRRSSSDKWESGVGSVSREMLAQSSSMSSILSVGLADWSSGISAGRIRKNGSYT